MGLKTRLLALETATHWLGVAVTEGETLLAERLEHRPMSQSAGLMPAVRETLREAGLDARDLEVVAVSQGPGSFTGLRIGAATARALADALRLPIAPVPTALALPLGAPEVASGTAVLAGPRDHALAQPFRLDAAGLPVATGPLRDTTYFSLASEAAGGGIWVCDPLAGPRLAEAGPTLTALHVVTPRALWVACYASRAGRTIPAREFAPIYGQSPVYRKRVQPA